LLIAPVTTLHERHGQPLPDGIPPVMPEPVTGQTPAPSIRITIGRVDVRAMMPELPKRRPTPERRPTLSLEDYLSQRSGEKQ
jgi:hypothetical protein